MGGGQHWFGGGFMWIFWLGVVIAVIWGVKIVMSNTSESSGQPKTALDILNERYAKGEIDQEEYIQRRNDLMAKH